VIDPRHYTDPEELQLPEFQSRLDDHESSRTAVVVAVCFAIGCFAVGMGWMVVTSG
jgi:CHASE3 domain sensor protein